MTLRLASCFEVSSINLRYKKEKFSNIFKNIETKNFKMEKFKLSAFLKIIVVKI